MPRKRIAPQEPDGTASSLTAVSAAYSRNQNQGNLALSGNVDIFEAETLHAAAKLTLDDADAAVTTIDLTKVTRLDLTAYQILAALKRDIALLGRDCVVKVSESLALAVTRSGFSL